VGVVLPEHFFAGAPHGTVSHQVWAVILKLAGSYVLAVGCWVVLLAWCAVQFGRRAGGRDDGGDYAEVPVPVLSGPFREDSVRLPLPESGDDAGGKA
jgi:hypothetical protein